MNKGMYMIYSICYIITRDNSIMLYYNFILYNIKFIILYTLTFVQDYFHILNNMINIGMM